MCKYIPWLCVSTYHDSMCEYIPWLHVYRAACWPSSSGGSTSSLFHESVEYWEDMAARWKVQYRNSQRSLSFLLVWAPRHALAVHVRHPMMASLAPTTAEHEPCAIKHNQQTCRRVCAWNTTKTIAWSSFGQILYVWQTDKTENYWLTFALVCSCW